MDTTSYKQSRLANRFQILTGGSSLFFFVNIVINFLVDNTFYYLQYILHSTHVQREFIIDSN